MRWRNDRLEFWLKTQAKQNGDKIFIDDGTNKITFASMYYEASRLAYQIKQLKKKLEATEMWFWRRMLKCLGQTE